MSFFGINNILNDLYSVIKTIQQPRTDGGTMKSKYQIAFLFALVMLTISLTAQNSEDLVGTWIGTATVQTEAEPNDLTLILEMNDGKLAGKMTDQFGTMNDTPIEEVSLDEGVFSFSISVEVPSGTFKLAFKMKVTGDSMIGELDVPDLGVSGTWEAEKQK